MDIKDTTWTIAGSDSGGGAGIQADLKVFNALNNHGCSVVTSVTAQNLSTVSHIEKLSPSSVEAQIQTLLLEFPPLALKLGLLGDSDLIKLIARNLKNINCTKVCDPVMVSTSGKVLLEKAAVSVLVDELFPVVSLITPNLVEAELLTGIQITSQKEMFLAGEKLVSMGAKAVLLKGGHLNLDMAVDLFVTEENSFWLTSPRQPIEKAHGTGCTLSAAIAAFCAQGHTLSESVVMGKAFLNEALSRRQVHGETEVAVLVPNKWPPTSENFPTLSYQPNTQIEFSDSPSCGPEALGLYPVVPSSQWIARLCEFGVSTAQLRIKDPNQLNLEEEIVSAIETAKKNQMRLFINDYWELAIKHNAYGVHLGQTDLKAVDMKQIKSAGLRLGLSSHSYEELAYAIGFKPSYVALGPIYPTTTKQMPWKPQGLSNLRIWKTLSNYPLVAIGGIFLEHAKAIWDSGVDGIALVREITESKDVAATIHEWNLRLK